MATIVNLAQDYIGSNNLNLLMPNGQFGTRDQGGKDHASARYIFTEPASISRVLFHPGDDPLLNYLKDDTADIEPEWYMPILPMILVNGAEGIGTGECLFHRYPVTQSHCVCQAGVRPFLAITLSKSLRTSGG